MHHDVRCRRPKPVSERVVLCTDDDQIRSNLRGERNDLGPRPAGQRDVYNTVSSIDARSTMGRRLTHVIVGRDNIEKRHARIFTKREGVRVIVRRSRAGCWIHTAHDLCEPWQPVGA